MLSETYFEAFWYKTGRKENHTVPQNLEGARVCCSPACICHCYAYYNQTVFLTSFSGNIILLWARIIGGKYPMQLWHQTICMKGRKWWSTNKEPGFPENVFTLPQYLSHKVGLKFSNAILQVEVVDLRRLQEIFYQISIQLRSPLTDDRV